MLLLTYLLFFSGTVVSGDERFIIDTIDSLATRGSLLLNQTVFERPLQTSDVEPAQPLLAVPLYWLAYQIQPVGNVHVLYLFSPIVTALAAVVLYRYALLTQYDQRVALIAGLALGLTTFAWPYAKTLFREPLTMLMIMLVVFGLEKWRLLFGDNDNQHWVWAGITLVILAIALSSKEAVWLLLPTFALLAIPSGFGLKQGIWKLAVVAGVAVLLITGLAFVLVNLDSALNTDSGRYEFAEQLRKLPGRIPQSWGGFSGFIFSPGRSIWVYAPIVLLSLASPLLLSWKRWRESWLMLLTLIAYALVYAALRGPVWYGGVGWGPRYLLPILPLLMIASLPGIKWLLQQGRWGTVALGSLLLLGFVIQVGGATVRLSDYYDYMQAQTGFAAWQGPGLWTFRWSQAFGSLLYLPQALPDIIWMLPPATDWLSIAVIVAAIAVSAFVLYRLQSTESFTIEQIIAVPAISLAVVSFALLRMYDDFRYNGHRTELHELRQLIEQETTSDNIILLNSPSYVEFFMNYYKGDGVWYSLPASPGEQYSCEQPAQVVSNNTIDLLHPEAKTMLDSIVSGAVKTFDPVYFVGDRAPFAPCNTRPVERYISEYMFPAQTADYEIDVRLMTYLPIFSANRGPSIAMLTEPTPVNARFGDTMQLNRFRLSYYGTGPDQMAFYSDIRPGDMLGFSLVWQALAPIEANYTVGFFLIAEDGQVVFQQDRGAVNDFAPTSSWVVGEEVYDNHGVILPMDMPQGRYDVVAVLYEWPSLERLEITAQNGSAIGDQIVLTTIEVGDRAEKYLLK